MSMQIKAGSRSDTLADSIERIIPETCGQSPEKYLEYLRHFFAYNVVRTLLSEQSSVLEIGCGDGYGASYLSQYVQHITGLDIYENVIHHASQKYQSERCAFQVYDGLHIPYQSQMYDAAIAFQVIEHIRDDRYFLTELQRVIKPDGMCILTTPNGMYRIKQGAKPWNRFHVREYYPNELERILKTLFADVRIWGIRGNEQIQQREKTRITRIQKWIALDPLNVRRLLPFSFEHFVRIVLRKLFRKERHHNQEFLKMYTINDYFLVKDQVDDCLDLLAICRTDSSRNV